MLFKKKIKLIMMTRRWRSIWKNNILHEIHQKYIYIWKHSHIITTECWQSHTTKMNIRKLGRTKKKKMRVGLGTGYWGRICSALWASLVAQMVMNPPANAGETDSILELGRSPGIGNGNPL